MLSRPTKSHVRGLTVSFLLLFVAATPAHAGVAMDSVSPPLRKLGRGLANVLTGVLEVPFKISAVNREQGSAAAITVGLLAGVGRALTRTVAGAVEVVTFLFPLPEYGYDPLLKPEFLLQPHSS